MSSVFVSTYLGHRFYPLEPRIDDVDIEDIAHGLAYQCRFNGQTNAFYSVAQHSIMVADLVSPPLMLAALLHDAAEAYLGDLVKPLKMLLPEFSNIEHSVTSIIGLRFCVDLSENPHIKRADLVALATEKRDLMPHSVEPWSYLEGIEADSRRIEPLMPDDAKREFLAMYDSLIRLRAGAGQLNLWDTAIGEI